MGLVSWGKGEGGEKRGQEQCTVISFHGVHGWCCGGGVGGYLVSWTVEVGVELLRVVLSS